MQKKQFVLYFALFAAVILLYTPKKILGGVIPYRDAELLAEVRERIMQNYVDEVSSKQLLNGALQGMLNTLDPYCEYLDKEAYKELFEISEGEFVGIGIVVGVENGMITVLSPVEDSPAAKAGILAGDRILFIENESTENMRLNEVIQKIRGVKGSKVKLSVLHVGEQIPEIIQVTRDTIHISSIKDAHIIDEIYKIGYLRLTKFNKHTGEELEQTIEKLLQQDMKSLIIDVRYNPGGLLNAAIDVVNLFIEKGTIVYTQGRTLGSKSTFTADNKKNYLDLPLVLLVNKRSASASEIVAGALQDYNRATIVGTTTYGKGLVQTILPLRDEETAIKITTARYYTPLGRSIQKTDTNPGGVEPDIEIPITTDEEKDLMLQFYKHTEVNYNKDKQLQQAIKILQK
ncbi:MAG: S41 family peptidase [Planctomycetes bacterium]|jgi:carboxyl-terminal processing protease|nr:S41 family peptidase [Planctomycetota bacterium]